VFWSSGQAATPRGGKHRALGVALSASVLAALAFGVPAAHAVDPPANDNFANAEVISGESVSVSGTRAGATSEPGEPQHGGLAAVHSVWYRWTAPHDGMVIADTCASATSGANLAVYSGSDVSSLQRLASNSGVGHWNAHPIGWPLDCGIHQSRVAFPVEEGEKYLAAVDQGTDAFELHLAFREPPPNDNFADATPLEGSQVEVEGDNLAATEEPGEPGSENAGSDASVWFTWTAPTSGVVSIDPCVGFDSQLRVVTGESLDSLQVIAERDCNYWGYGPFRVERGVSAGTTLTLMMDGNDSFDADAPRGTFRGFHIKLDEPPPNDLRENATELAGRRTHARATTVGAFQGAESETLNSGGAAVWYRWRAPADGWLRLKACAPGAAVGLAVYRHARDHPFASTPPGLDACDEFPLHAARVRKGRPYFIEARTFNSLDEYTMHVAFPLRLALREHPPRR
jgi:hypothetical protein